MRHQVKFTTPWNSGCLDSLSLFEDRVCSGCSYVGGIKIINGEKKVQCDKNPHKVCYKFNNIFGQEEEIEIIVRDFTDQKNKYHNCIEYEKR
jgi:hypothetical protein